MRNFKKITLLILAATLVLTLSLGLLVACGETDGAEAPSSSVGSEDGPDLEGGSDPSQGGGPFEDIHDEDTTEKSISASAYFDKFDELSRALGATEIEKGADLYFHSEFSGKFGLKNEEGTKDDSFELGFEAEAILDRTSKDADGEFTSQNSAIRVRAFSGSTDIFAASFFVSDPLSIYIDLAGSRIKLSAEFVYEDNNLNELLGRAIGKALNKEFDFDLGAMHFGFSLNKLLDAIVEGTGAEWSPTVLLKSLAKLIGIDDGSGMPDISSDYDMPFLEKAFSDTFNATQTGDDYSIILDTRDTNFLMHALFDKLFGVNFLFKMNFTEDDGRLKDGVRFELGLPELLNSDGRHPYAGICVNILELLPVEGKEIAMSAPKTEYKGDIAFKFEEAFTPTGFKLFGSELRELRLSEAFRLDLIHPLETNETAAQLKLAMANDALGEDVLFEASFVKGRLALKIDPKVVFKEGTLIGDTSKKLLDFALGLLKESDPALETRIADEVYVGGADGDRKEINDNFHGIVVNDIPVKEIFDAIVSDAIDAYKMASELPEPTPPKDDAEDPSYDGWELPSLEDLKKFTPAYIMRERILPAIGLFADIFTTLDDGKIGVHTNDILGLLLGMTNTLIGLEGDDALTEDKLFDRTIEGMTNVVDMLAEIGLVTYDENTPDALSLLNEAFEKVFEVFEVKDAPEKLKTESFAKYAMRLLVSNTSFDLDIDLNDGWRYSLGVGVAGAKFIYSRSFTPWEGLEVHDLYDEAEQGWALLDFSFRN